MCITFTTYRSLVSNNVLFVLIAVVRVAVWSQPNVRR